MPGKSPTKEGEGVLTRKDVSGYDDVAEPYSDVFPELDCLSQLLKTPKITGPFIRGALTNIKDVYALSSVTLTSHRHIRRTKKDAAKIHVTVNLQDEVKEYTILPVSNQRCTTYDRGQVYEGSIHNVPLSKVELYRTGTTERPYPGAETDLIRALEKAINEQKQKH